MVDAAENRPKTEKELKNETEKAAKLAKFEEKQKKLADDVDAATARPAKEVKAKKEPATNVIPVDNTAPVEKKDLASEIPSAKPESFTLCIPPPNVTGTLHVGHALATTAVENIITRFQRMQEKLTQSKSPTNWIDLPMEMRAECIKRMNFKTRMRLRATSHTEKSLVESAPKINFHEVKIDQTNILSPVVMGTIWTRTKREFVCVTEESQCAKMSLSNDYQLMLQVFKYAIVNRMKFSLTLENDDEADQFISDICSSAPFKIRDLDLTTVNPKVAQFLVRNTEFKDITLKRGGMRNTEGSYRPFLLQDFVDIPETGYSRSWDMKDKQTHDDVFMLIEKWIENDTSEICTMNCTVNSHGFIDKLFEKFGDRIYDEVDEDDDSFEIIIQTDYLSVRGQKLKKISVICSFDNRHENLSLYCLRSS